MEQKWSKFHEKTARKKSLIRVTTFEGILYVWRHIEYTFLLILHWFYGVFVKVAVVYSKLVWVSKIIDFRYQK